MVNLQEFAEEIAQEAGKIMMNARSREFGVYEKEDESLVTDIDMKVEKHLIKRIHNQFPGHGIHSEEKGTIDGESSLRWILDPIDGTHNYTKDMPMFGCSIACYRNDDPLVGVLYLPALNKLYSAARGEGATCNGKQIKVNGADQMNHTVIAVDSTYAKQTEPTILHALSNNILSFRIIGSAAVCLGWLAEGKVDGYILWDTFFHDFAAGYLIVEEAGGIITQLDGKDWGPKSKRLLASNGKLHQELLNTIS